MWSKTQPEPRGISAPIFSSLLYPSSRSAACFMITYTWISTPTSYRILVCFFTKCLGRRPDDKSKERTRVFCHGVQRWLRPRHCHFPKSINPRCPLSPRLPLCVLPWPWLSVILCIRSLFYLDITPLGSNADYIRAQTAQKNKASWAPYDPELEIPIKIFQQKLRSDPSHAEARLHDSLWYQHTLKLYQGHPAAVAQILPGKSNLRSDVARPSGAPACHERHFSFMQEASVRLGPGPCSLWSAAFYSSRRVKGFFWLVSVAILYISRVRGAQYSI
jgi:hypothetical protein